MIQITRIRIQYLNGDNVVKQGDAPAAGLTFTDMKEVNRYRKALESFYQAEYDQSKVGKAKISVLLDTREDERHFIYTYKCKVYQATKKWRFEQIERVLTRIGATYWEISI